MNWKAILWGVVIVVVIALVSSAAWAVSCGSRAKIKAMLVDKYGETLRGIATAGPGAVIELYRSNSGTWTMVATMSDGRTCVIGAGHNWKRVKPGQKPKPKLKGTAT